MFGLEKLTIIPKIIVRNYIPKRTSLTLSFIPKPEPSEGPKLSVGEIWLPENRIQSMAFLSNFMTRLSEIPELNAGVMSMLQHEVLFRGDVRYETNDGVLKIVSIEESHRKDDPADVRTENTLESGALPFTVSYVNSSKGESYVEIYVLTTHPEIRVDLGNLIHEKINAAI